YAKASPNGGGIVAANGGDADAVASRTIEAGIAAGSTITTINNAEVRADGTNKAHAEATTVTIGIGVAIAATLADAVREGPPRAYVGTSATETTTLTVLNGDFIVESLGSNQATANAEAATGGIISGRGADAGAYSRPTNEARFGNALGSASGDRLVAS